MDRNFSRRVEIAFPIQDPALKERVMKEGLQPYLNDNTDDMIHTRIYHLYVNPRLPNVVVLVSMLEVPAVVLIDHVLERR